jgi:predicted transcriptional regulator
LNFKTALPYLDLLTRGGLLETVPGESTIYIYKTTAKGRKALKALRAIEAIIPERCLQRFGQSARDRRLS